MTTARFFFTIFGFGALTLGLSVAGETSNQAGELAPSENRATTIRDSLSDQEHAVQPGAGPERVDGKPMDDHRVESHPSRKGSQTGGAKTTAMARSDPKVSQPFQGNGKHPDEERTNNARTKSSSGVAAGLHQAGLNPSARIAKAGPMIDPIANHRGVPVGGLSVSPPPNQVVHFRGPGPAIIGGPANSSTTSTAALNGTGMKHKP